MIPIAGKLHSSIKLLLAALLFAVLPLIVGAPRVTAMTADHSMHAEQMNMDCASACARSVGMLPTQATLEENETRAPDPSPKENAPYHVQFQAAYTPIELRPSPLYTTSPSRPPDIVKMSTHFRF